MIKEVPGAGGDFVAGLGCGIGSPGQQDGTKPHILERQAAAQQPVSGIVVGRGDGSPAAEDAALIARTAGPGHTDRRVSLGNPTGAGIVFHDQQGTEAAGDRQPHRAGGTAEDSGATLAPGGVASGEPPRRDLPVPSGDAGGEGEQPMDRDRAKSILSAIADFTEDDFVAQEDQDHIGGHTLREIQQAVEVRAAELFEQNGAKNVIGRLFIYKDTPQGKTELDRRNEAGDAIVLGLYEKELRTGASRHRLLTSFRLPMNSEPTNHMSYTDRIATPDQISVSYQRYFDGTMPTAEDNLGFFRGFKFLAANLMEWEENHTVMPQDLQNAGARGQQGAIEPAPGRVSLNDLEGYRQPDRSLEAVASAQSDPLARLEELLRERIGEEPDSEPTIFRARGQRFPREAHPDPRIFDAFRIRGRERRVEIGEGDRTPVQVIIDTSPRQDPDRLRMKQRTQANIESSQDAVANGRHGTVLYPASGTDHLRVLLAYDADHLISIDSDERLQGSAEDQIRRLGIEPTIQVLDGGSRRNITFTLDERERTITEVIGDARSYSPQNFGLQQVDVLLVYAPLHAGIMYPEHPVPETYPMVAEGGFFVFGESDLRLNAYPIPPSLAELIGLEAKTITRRHPYTISTMDPELDKYLTEDKKTGYIYQKVRTVDIEAIKIFNEVLIANSHMHYDFDMFEKGKWENLGVTEENSMNVQAGVQQRYEQLREEVDAYAQRFARASIGQDLIDAYRAETLQMFENKVLGLQKKMKELLQVHYQAKQMSEDGFHTEVEILQFLGFISPDGRDSLESTRGPLARTLFRSGQEKSIETLGILTQFVETDFQTWSQPYVATIVIGDRLALDGNGHLQLGNLTTLEREVYERLKNQFSDESLATLLAFADRVRDGLQNPPLEEGTPELEIEEHPHPEEVSQHLLTVAGPIDIHDPRHGMVHGTSMEVVKAILKYGVIPGYIDSLGEPRREKRDISVYPTPELYRMSSEVRGLLYPHGVKQVTDLPENAKLEAGSYADVLAVDHVLLSMLGIPLTERMRFAEETSALLFDEDGFSDLQALGIPREEIMRLRDAAKNRKGFLLTFSPDVLREPGVTMVEGDMGDADIAIRPGNNHLRYGLITGIQPLGPEEAAFLDSLRGQNS